MINKINQHKRRLYFFLVLLILSLIVYFAMQNPSIRQLDWSPSKNQADFSFDQVIITQFDNGNKTWEMKSDFAQIYKKNNEALLKRVSGNIYHEDELILTFASPDAHLELSNSKLQLKQSSAIAKLPNKTVSFSSDSFEWDPSLNRIIGTGAIQLNSDDVELAAEKISVDIPIKTIKIEGQAVLNVK